MLIISSIVRSNQKPKKNEITDLRKDCGTNYFEVAFFAVLDNRCQKRNRRSKRLIHFTSFFFFINHLPVPPLRRFNFIQKLMKIFTTQDVTPASLTPMANLLPTSLTVTAGVNDTGDDTFSEIHIDYDETGGIFSHRCQRRRW
jgi:hypothetical protein